MYRLHETKDEELIDILDSVFFHADIPETPEQVRLSILFAAFGLECWKRPRF